MAHKLSMDWRLHLKFSRPKSFLHDAEICVVQAYIPGRAPRGLQAIHAMEEPGSRRLGTEFSVYFATLVWPLQLPQEYEHAVDPGATAQSCS